MNAADVQVKICGITRPPDAIAAVEAGADAVGLMFYERSRRWVTLEQAREVVSVLPERTARVGVFVDADEVTIGRAIEACGLHILQLHGGEPPEFCKRFGSVRVWKAFRVTGPEVLGVMTGFDTDAWLLDAAVAGQLGGSGQQFDWELAVQARALGRPIVLAGGLTPGNVRKAVERVRPYGVDVSSGVESAPGVKDFDKMRAFVVAAKGQSGFPLSRTEGLR